MKRLLISLVLFFMASPVFAQTITWTLPSQYTDNTSISVGDQATITTKIYYATTSVGCATGTLFQTILNGATSWGPGALPVTGKGSTTYYCGTAIIPAHGLESAKGPPTAYTVPFVAPKAPDVINIVF